ncbi:hypothetical protein EDD22DRAFT_900313 [Suillus occidentalis]|nr:hypothetical protein EDD22DRAFT_900313 [Suillus occidentalis]
MPSIVNLKFKGNKSFVAFSNLSDTESLTKTWKVCTKVASYLEQGQRLENLSWRLWHLQNLMVDTDNAKSKREFKKLSKNMGDKLDKEKGRAIESLEAPDLNATLLLTSSRSREASQNARPGTIKRMQFTFSIDAPPGSFPATSSSSYTFSGEASTPTKPDLRPSAEFREGRRRRRGDASNASSDAPSDPERYIFRLFSVPRLDPTALLYSTPTLSNPMSYGEGVSGGCATGFSIFRPTIELPLDELLGEEMGDATEDGNDEGDVVMRYDEYTNNSVPAQPEAESAPAPPAEQDHHPQPQPQPQQPTPDPFPAPQVPSHSHTHTQSHPRTRGKDRSGKTPTNRPVLTKPTKAGRRASGVKSPSSGGAKHTAGASASASATAPVSASATATTRGGTALAPGGVKAERGLNDDATSVFWIWTLLSNFYLCFFLLLCFCWGRRGGASSLASALATLASVTPLPPAASSSAASGAAAVSASVSSITRVSPSTGASAAKGAGAGTGASSSAQCYNCHTTATPLWRKDEEGKTVCNASRSSLTDPPTSNTPGTPSETPSQTQTPSGSPGVSRRPTPSPSPILAPDSTTQPVAVASHSMSAGMSAGMVGTVMGSSSELMGALGDTYAVYNPFPGPYHPDYLSQNWVPPCVGGGAGEALPFSGVDSVDGEGSGASSSNASPKTSSATHVSGSGAAAPPTTSASGGGGTGANTSTAGRTAKRRRMSTDSVSEPPSSAVSYSSYGGGDSSFTTSGATSAGTSSSSRRSSMDFPFFSPYTVFRGNGNNAFWHHSSGGGSPQAFVHPPMLPDAGEHGHGHGHGGHGGHGNGNGHGHGGRGGMDFLHPPMMLPQEEESLFATYLHPPMILPQEGEQVQHGYEYQGEYYETGSMQQY